MLQDQGRLAEAEVLKRVDLAAERAKGGDRHPNTLVALNNLATNLLQQGKLAEAELLSRQALALERQRLAAERERKRRQRQRWAQA